MQHFSRIRTFMLELDAGRGPGVAYRGGELLSGRVVLDVAKGLKVRALAVCARGLAATHWLESKSFGMNTVYSDYTAYETYLRRRQHLIRGSHPLTEATVENIKRLCKISHPKEPREVEE